MGDLEPYMNESFIFQAFEQMGESVAKVKQIPPKQTRGPAGYCFVEFSSHEASQRAMLRLNGKVIPGSAPPKRFKLNRASFGREHLVVPEFSIFVGDINEVIDDYNLFTIFSSRYKSCRGAKVVIDSNGKSRGYGFVRFGDESEHQRALTEMQGFTGINVKPLRVSLATPKKIGSSQTTSTESSAVPNNVYQQQYYPNYQPFYNSVSGWWNAYQSPTDYYYGAYGYGDQSYGATATDSTNGQAIDEDSVEDPFTHIDVEQSNTEYITQSEELFTTLEESRWFPIDMLTSSSNAATTTKVN